MLRYRSVLVCVKSSHWAARNLAYLSPMSRAAQTQHVHLLHAKPEGHDSAKFTPEDLRKLAADNFKGHGNETIVAKVIDRPPLVEILRYALEQEIDLIVVGRRAGDVKDAGHEATLVRRVTRTATCSVLVLPENTEPGIQRILVPARDSDCSANALDVACGIAKAFGAKVRCLNVFHVTSGYKRVGTTLEEHTALLRKGAEKECRRLLDRVDGRGVDVETRCVPDQDGQPVPIISANFATEGADLLVIGSRGRTGAAGVLLGHVTEQLIRESAIPVLAVKRKGECIGVLRALLELA
ncbi:MAG: universal stress protein [Planctomycetota bacterium]